MREPIRALAEDLLAMLRFYSRLPLPIMSFERAPHGAPDFGRAAPLLPFAGAIISGAAGLTGVLALLAGLDALSAAAVVVMFEVFLTGAFHEDGLADTADGFWGGASPERRLEIMRDSRIGSYGAAALCGALLLRTALLAALVGAFGPWSALLLAGAGALSRTLPLVLLANLPVARADGAAFAVQPPAARSLGLALTFGIGLFLGATAIVGAGGSLAALALAGMATAALASLAKAKIGGQTGDVLGATQQISLVAILLALVAAR